ncbi:hypothetical protein GU926_04385 [Nibribacter ruber]|uniref:Uncharacterized protein n=1 Tax=Nibribacter ruber TaxID=2698458 RepID=A0A6P1NWL7_9BACT|nr:hypothetical protein [Nibribacter ruber]QHL86714.1 hypothetical protein GU926_04385 [Nibribacter ruber]
MSYQQRAENGHIVFTAISKEAHTYCKGTYSNQSRHKVFPRINMYFYDRESVQAEFDRAGLVETIMVEDAYPFHQIPKITKATIF